MHAFERCSNLTSLDIPDSVQTIGKAAFLKCAGLTSIKIPDGITAINDSTFERCTSLAEVIIPDSVQAIGSWAFSCCLALTSIDIPDTVKTIGDLAFLNSGLTSIDIPDSVTRIGSSAFSDCDALKSVVLPEGIKVIDEMTFSGCTSLAEIYIPASVTKILQSAFEGCTALKEVYFGGTPMQCAVIEVGNYNDALDNVTVYCALEYPFSDISNSGYRDYISLGQALGIVNGYPDGTFRPNNTVTRAQYITMLYNMYGKPDVSGYSLNFKDKNSISGPYVDAVKWGVATGIVSGYGDNTFRPNRPVTRAQYITMLYNMCGRPEVITPGLLFKDTASISAPYLDAVKWGVVNGIINGYGDNTFRPDQQITRAQMAAFSYRLMKLAVGGEFKDEVKADCGFKDSSSIAKDYKEAVNVMANLGIITGFDTDNDGKGDTFRPNATANRGQAATIIVRVAISLGIVS